jgi:hypothetical protein
VLASYSLSRRFFTGWGRAQANAAGVARREKYVDMLPTALFTLLAMAGVFLGSSEILPILKGLDCIGEHSGLPLALSNLRSKLAGSLEDVAEDVAVTT